MKRTVRVCLRTVLVCLFALNLGCHGGDSAAPTSPTASVDGVVVEESGGTVHTSAVTPAANPSLTRISGETNAYGLTDGVISLNCGLAVVNGARAINDQPGAYRWTLSGTGFGWSKGSVTVAGQASPVVSWSDSRIVIDPTLPWNSGPMSTWLVVRTATGATAYRGMTVAPSLRTGLYGQCTHFVALRRLQTGREPSPTAYGGQTTIGASWVPRASDILNFGPNRHTAFIESVGPRTIERDGTVVYPLQVSDQNGDCRGSIRTTVTAFKVRAAAVVQPPRSSASGLGGAVSYYR